MFGNNFKQKQASDFSDELCYETCSDISKNDEEKMTPLSHMEIFGNQKLSKLSCEKCQYITNRKSNFDAHLLSAKHVRKCFGNQIKQIKQNAENAKKEYACDICSKIYKTNSGLWKHKQQCKIKPFNENITTNEILDVIKHLIKDNQQFTKDLINSVVTNQNNTIKEITKCAANTTNNINNSHNKSFNLNVFLNETCKDAMNISEFVSSIKVNLEDLENTGRRGYIEGISDIFLKNLNNIEQHMRPFHCSDLKREILYIKDNNEWTRESDEKPILTKAIKTIANENIKQIKYWREKYPDCTFADSKKNNMYLKIVSNSMNGSTPEEGNKNINKIISNVVKESVIIK